MILTRSISTYIIHPPTRQQGLKSFLLEFDISSAINLFPSCDLRALVVEAMLILEAARVIFRPRGVL